MQLESGRQQKFISYSWLALTLFYLFLRYQNIPGVFSEAGIITIDTDPYYRLHRIKSIVQGDWFYPLFDRMLNFPIGREVSWPLGLDYVIALPLKVLGIQDHSSILIFSFLIMPILTLPILILTGKITSRLGTPILGLAAGLFVTLMNIVLQQTSVGRLDHHGLECLFVLLQFWFLLKINGSESKFTQSAFIVCLGLAPSMYPHAWIPVVCLSLALLIEKNHLILSKMSQIFFFAFCLSLVPLSFSDYFLAGSISVAGFSWLPSFILIGSSFYTAMLSFLRNKKVKDRNFLLMISGSFFIVLVFLILKQGQNIFFHQVSEGLSFLSPKNNTLSVTVEMFSPFEFSWETLGEKILLFVLPLVYLWFFYFKKFTQLLLYTLPVIILAYFQVRFIVPAGGFVAILIVLWLWDLADRIKWQQSYKIASLFVSIVLISWVYMPHLGLTKTTSDSQYFQPVQHASIFLRNQVKEHQSDPKKAGILASWDYGHWILFYSGLPIIASPFQGNIAAQSYSLLASENVEDFERFQQVVPVKYLMLDQFPGRFYNVLEYAGKNPEDYFAFEKADDGTYKKMSPKPLFDHVLYQRFLKNYGANDEGDFPNQWRLIYSSPYPAQYAKNLPALKVFENVSGAVIRMHTKSKKLWLEIQIKERDQIKVMRKASVEIEPNVLQWTVPYSQYSNGDVFCDGIYMVIDEKGQAIGQLPVISESNILKGEVLTVQ